VDETEDRQIPGLAQPALLARPLAPDEPVALTCLTGLDAGQANPAALPHSSSPSPLAPASLAAIAFFSLPTQSQPQADAAVSPSPVPTALTNGKPFTQLKTRTQP